MRDDSDVIELTEEVKQARKQAQAEANAEPDDFDLFGDDLSMPEFRVPQERTPTDPNGVPQAAILGRKSRAKPHAPALETLKMSLSEIDHEERAPGTRGLPPGVPSARSELGALEESSAISLEIESDAELPDERLDEVVDPALLRARPEHTRTVQIPSLNRSSLPPLEPATPDQGQIDPGQEEHEEAAYGGAVAPEADAEAVSSPEEREDQGDNEVYDRQELVRTIQMAPVSRDAIALSIDVERLHHASALEDQRFAPDVVNRPPRILNRKWVEGVERILGPGSGARPPAIAPREPSAASPPSAGQVASPPQSVSSPLPSEARRPPHASPPAAGAAASLRTTQPTSPQPAVAAAAAPAVATASAPPKKGEGELDGLVQELIEESTAPKLPPSASKRPNGKPERPQDGKEDWFKEVFNEEFLRTVPRDVERFTEREGRFIHSSLSLQSGSRVLDLACGFGRHAVVLTQRNLEIVGLDLSMALLQRALQEAQRRNLSIKFVHGDMRSMNFNAIFDGCYLWQSSFGFFDDATNFKVLKDIARALKPGGRFLLDVMNRDYVVTEMPSRCWWEGRECIFLEEVDFDFSKSVLHTKRSFIYEDGSPPLEQNSFVRLYNLHEIAHLVKSAGFHIVEVSGGLSMRNQFLGANSERMIFLLEKAVKKPAQPQLKRA